MSQFYQIVYARVSHRELWWWHRSPLVLISWLNKWAGAPVNCTSDDAHTETTLPFVVASLQPEVEESFAPLANELASLGFIDPVYHVIYDVGSQVVFYWATYRHVSGKYFARIHRRVWHRAANPNRALYPLFFTAFTDGTFLVSSAGKPDMASPQTVQMNRLPNAKIERLWEKHQQLSHKLEGQKNIAPVHSQSDLINVTEQYHILLRDFHLARGVFRPRTTEEHVQATTFATQVTQARAEGLEHGEILAELKLLQTQKSNWRGTIWLLVFSVIVFFVAGLARWNLNFTLWLIPVLFLHESGHWLAMRIFHYRNLRMFFIPLFGAAVTGRNWNVPGWKKSLVSLAGPLPGILLGIPLAIAGLALHIAWLNQLALILLLINGFNLLPVLPLDGGHVLQYTVFCRHRWLDLVFRVLAIICLLMMGASGVSKFFIYLGIVMAVGLPRSFRLGKVTQDLRQADLPSPPADSDEIPFPTAQTIITALKAVLPKNTSNRQVAQNTLTVFESLNTRPPGFIATAGLLFLQGGAFLMAIILCFLLIIGRSGSVGDFFRASLAHPHHRYLYGSVQVQPATEAVAGAKDLIVATFKNHLAAATSFESLTNQLPGNTRLTFFGDSLLAALPTADQASHNQLLGSLNAATTNIFTAVSNEPVTVHLMFIAPTTAVATNIQQELNEYFTAGNGLQLMAPWSPDVAEPVFTVFRHARANWLRINEAVANNMTNASLAELSRQFMTALQQNNTNEINRVTLEISQTRHQLENEAINQLRTDTTAPVNPDLLDLWIKLSNMSETNQTTRQLWLQTVKSTLGPAQLTGALDPYGATTIVVERHGLLVDIPSVSFSEADIGLPALANWLGNQRCEPVRYDFLGTFGDDD